MKTEHTEGYTEQEINRFLLTNKSIDPQFFFKHLDRIDCIIVDGKVLIPHKNVDDVIGHHMLTQLGLY